MSDQTTLHAAAGSNPGSEFRPTFISGKAVLVALLGTALWVSVSSYSSDIGSKRAIESGRWAVRYGINRLADNFGKKVAASPVDRGDLPFLTESCLAIKNGVDMMKLTPSDRYFRVANDSVTACANFGRLYSLQSLTNKQVSDIVSDLSASMREIDGDVVLDEQTKKMHDMAGWKSADIRQGSLIYPPVKQGHADASKVLAPRAESLVEHMANPSSGINFEPGTR